MLDDVVRHGPHDLYWCYRFERSVSLYKSMKTNLKQSEVTYSHYEACLAFLSVRELKQRILTTYILHKELCWRCMAIFLQNIIDLELEEVSYYLTLMFYENTMGFQNY